MGNFCQERMATISYRGEKRIPGGPERTGRQGAPGWSVTGGKILLGWLLSGHLVLHQLAVRVLVLRESD